MDVPSQCTIVRTMDRSAYNSKVQGVVGSRDEDSAQRNAQNTQKKQVCCISVKKGLSNIVHKVNLYP
jgi:hypothetical protein